MLQLISHIVRTSARRDRTEINGALVDAMVDLFHPLSLSIHRCYPSKQSLITFTCAGIGADGLFNRNAYLPDREYCRPIDQDPLLNRCRREMSIVLEQQQDGAHRVVFPLIQSEHLLYLIDVRLAEDFSADQRVLLMGLTEYFSNHIALLDYGETDTLTGLANRKTFDKHLFEVLGRARADAACANSSAPRRRKGSDSDASHWLAVCDIDHFKRVNDGFGHLMGDEVLVALAHLMRDSFRFDDQLFRFGGEEFVVVLQPTNGNHALGAIERFRLNVDKKIFSVVGHVTVSVGFTRLREHDTPSGAIDRADEALYFAKRNGRNQAARYETLVENGTMEMKDVTTGDIELF